MFKKKKIRGYPIKINVWCLLKMFGSTGPAFLHDARQLESIPLFAQGMRFLDHHASSVSLLLKTSDWNYVALKINLPYLLGSCINLNL